MKYIYTVTGMTCNNCKASVENALRSIEDVKQAEVNFETSTVEIIADKPISITAFQEVLSAKYRLSEIDNKQVFQENYAPKPEGKNDIKELFPLLLIFIYISAAATLLNSNPWDLENFMLDFMGLFYIVFSFFKLLDLKGFPKSFRMYDPLANVMPIYGWIYPFIELTLGLLFLMRIGINTALIVTLVILGITTVGVLNTLLNRKAIQCACLGTALKLPMTKATFIENSIMIIMAIIMLLKTYN
ncbi:heavy-metal-associated domain-containing protein [uncultured Psychroserpens sp.]|uniref:heavy-metal-associated domain-containing protein n=1 Tax=uncultured Psychroserpens sp. TaxID=255436 RepID=UPI00260C406D|nr:MauE/DoxX family redox-associated membrane protein [uncultured Psychroserpens sp.]